ncbi:MAG: hypothetical protein QW702_05445 [Candidatus Bathyarchaeia archaeon]
MRKSILLAALGLVTLSAIIISTYSALAWYNGYPRITQIREFRATPVSAEPPCIINAQNFTWNFKRYWRWMLGNECGRWKMIVKGDFRRAELELSEEFKERVLDIASKDEDVQSLLNEGYNISCIRPVHMKSIVQENGQVTIEVDEVLLVLTKDKYSRAFIEVDLKAEKVTRITMINVTVIEKSTAT